ncbi:MAG TPA: flagellar motor switch protein FliN [Nitrospirales bacterium]|nr:flagellar motor switch protein FliN [Nitrospirales bacterium]
MSEQESGGTVTDETKPGDNPPARPADFPPLEPTGSGNPLSGMDFILDIPLQLSARLGSTRMIIRDLLQLGQGSVVELDKLAGEPIEVLVNGKLVARGEAVVVNEKLGIRLTEVISPMERIRNLQQ